MSNDNMSICYNRGCGKQFDPNNNKDDCFHHPGHPVFHDAYKQWSCCSKKTTDFTEFLNIKGCTKSKHSNVKPVDVSKPAVSESKTQEVKKVIAKPSNNVPPAERPAFDTPQLTLKPTISPALLEQIANNTVANKAEKENQTVMGQSCKNNSCKSVYTGPASNDEVCVFHSGVPVFHEGLKYWSCCCKKTTEFSTFLAQPGCCQGNHIWAQKSTSKLVNCRLDWHQTGTNVIVSVFAKKYNPNLSSVKLNPIRLTLDLNFPENDSMYNLDIELREVVDVEASSVNMLPTKVEITLKKKEPTYWSKLEISKETKTEKSEEETVEETYGVEAVNLDDV